jgi:DNA-binding MarR family transcriptional regulator
VSASYLHHIDQKYLVFAPEHSNIITLEQQYTISVANTAATQRLTMTSGPYRKATTEAVLTAIRSHYAPAVGTADIADDVGVARQTVDNRLRELWDNGLVDSMKVGRSRIWWLTTDGKKELLED